jgi:hypothetical protein
VTYFIPVTIVLGYAGAVCLSYFCGRLLITYMCGPVYLRHLTRNFEGMVGGAGLLIALFPGMFWCTAAGGKSGAEIGELMFGANGIVVGLAVSIILVTVAVTSLGALAGVAAGKFLKTAISPRSSD